MSAWLGKQSVSHTEAISKVCHLPSSIIPESAEQVVPSLHSMQQEPAWLAIVAEHQPEDWPDSAPPPNCHQDVVYLSSEQAMSKDAVQAIHSFYSFIWVCLRQLITPLGFTHDI